LEIQPNYRAIRAVRAVRVVGVGHGPHWTRTGKTSGPFGSRERAMEWGDLALEPLEASSLCMSLAGPLQNSNKPS